jgi:hypothetical protein
MNDWLRIILEDEQGEERVDAGEDPTRVSVFVAWPPVDGIRNKTTYNSLRRAEDLQRGK